MWRAKSVLGRAGLGRVVVGRSLLAFALAMGAVTVGGTATAHADDYYNRGDTGHYAYENGYRDGLRHGRFDRNEHHHYNIHSQQYNDANAGYDRGMGPFGYYKRSYRDGYANGYAEGFNSWRGDGDRWRERPY